MNWFKKFIGRRKPTLDKQTQPRDIGAQQTPQAPAASSGTKQDPEKMYTEALDLFKLPRTLGRSGEGKWW